MMFKQADVEILPAYKPAVAEQPSVFVEPEWWANPEAPGYGLGKVLRLLIKSFVTGTLFGKQRIQWRNGKHVFYTKNAGTELWMFKDNPSVKVEVCIAKRVGCVFLGNSSSLVAARMSDGTIKWMNAQAMNIQEIIEEVMPMIPFRLFEEHKLDLNSLEIIERGKPERIDVGWVNHETQKPILRHFMGAMVFRIKGGGSVPDRDFLFDIDRNDLKMKKFNAFLSRLSRPCTSIADAYASLKPKEVYDAEARLGHPMPRQGEWFFIPVEGQEFMDIKRRRGVRPVRVGDNMMDAVLQSKGNRAHYVDFLSQEGFVSGVVRHGGWEHKPIQLEGWHKAVPNTAVESFTIRGDVD